jgi:hypothetical protein
MHADFFVPLNLTLPSRVRSFFEEVYVDELKSKQSQRKQLGLFPLPESAEATELKELVDNFLQPIAGCDETSQTIYYESANGTQLEKVYKPDERHYRIIGETREVYRFALTCPALIRNDVAHDVKRFNATSTRIIASWGVSGTFEQCCDAFQIKLSGKQT